MNVRRRRQRTPGDRHHGAALALLVALLVAGCGDGVGDVAGGPGTTSVDAQSATTSDGQEPGCETPLSVTVTTTTFDDSTTATKQNGSTTTAASTSGHPTSTTAPPTSSIPQTSTTTSTTLASSTSSSTPVDDVLAGHQQRLTDLGYWLGTVDSQAGSLTAHAVTAFQKAEGLPRTGQLDDATVERLANATTPRARSSTGVVLEIDLARQILLVADDGIVTRIYDIATGAAATPTPPGQFEIDREIDGIRDAPLGRLYRPKYFNGGIALHGYTSVPPQPASHGCVRLTYAAMDDLWASGRAPVGTPVWVS